MSNSVERFSSTIANYIRYRPSYPQSLLDTLISKTQLNGASSIADIGAGTGIFSQCLLQNNLSVTAIEPNKYMLAAAKLALGSDPNFRYLNNSAEQTGLTARSIDLICAAQSFHWFHNQTTRAEFARILKPQGYLALIWNQREALQPFYRQYDAILKKYATDYETVNHQNISNEQISRFYAPGSVTSYCFNNQQQFDFTGLMGRIKSCSYCPSEDSTAFKGLENAVNKLFVQFSDEGLITLEYNCKLYLGRLHV
ncbi:MAG: class I SAM-dependent methyltransferase [Oceanospirillaceae bacterium]|nr:class I SAM-dependent methyltransferase [Oceanospirillaceae bacterium]